MGDITGAEPAKAPASLGQGLVLPPGPGQTQERFVCPLFVDPTLAAGKRSRRRAIRGGRRIGP
jgi:hypothetical protein